MKSNNKEINKYIKEVSEKTGWSIEKTETEMNRAKENGMTYYRYANNQCWQLNDDEIKLLAEKLEKQAEIRKSCVKEVCEKTGLDEKTAEQKIKDVKEKYPEVTYKLYVKKEMWDLKDEEIEELLQLEEKWSKYRENRNNFFLNVVCKNSGWDSEVAKEKMNAAVKLGISWRRYALRGGWNYDETNMQKLVNLVENDKERFRKSKSEYRGKIGVATGWTPAKVDLEVKKAKVNCGASYEDFYIFKMYNLTPEKQREIVTLDLFEQMRKTYDMYDLAVSLFDDKAKFNEVFDDEIERVWFKNDGLTYEDFLKNIKGLKYILIKPLGASRGIGVQKFPCNVSEDENKKLYDLICELDTSIIEECIVQHEEMSEFCRTAVNTIRITTLNYQNECKFLYAVLRMGRDGVVDNFHAGGVVAGVDCETGVVCTNAVDWDRNVYEVSPSTGKRIKGFQVPHWDKVLETCRKVTGKVEGVNLIGWDFAIKEDGVEIIEGNPGVSYVIAQMPFAEEGIGLCPTMIDPYL